MFQQAKKRLEKKRRKQYLDKYFKQEREKIANSGHIQAQSQNLPEQNGENVMEQSSFKRIPNQETNIFKNVIPQVEPGEKEEQLHSKKRRHVQLQKQYDQQNVQELNKPYLKRKMRIKRPKREQTHQIYKKNEIPKNIFEKQKDYGIQKIQQQQNLASKKKKQTNLRINKGMQQIINPQRKKLSFNRIQNDGYLPIERPLRMQHVQQDSILPKKEKKQFRMQYINQQKILPTQKHIFQGVLNKKQEKPQFAFQQSLSFDRSKVYIPKQMLQSNVKMDPEKQRKKQRQKQFQMNRFSKVESRIAQQASGIEKIQLLPGLSMRKDQKNDNMYYIGYQMQGIEQTFFIHRFIHIQKRYIQQIVRKFRLLEEQTKLPQTQKIQGSDVIMIKDQYKGKTMYGLRHYNYYANQIQPTRVGFNLSEKNMKEFINKLNDYI